jgi:hypothetical protein
MFIVLGSFFVATGATPAVLLATTRRRQCGSGDIPEAFVDGYDR